MIIAWNFKDSKTGQMCYTQRYKGTLSCETDLKMFPFDVVAIPIIVGCKILKNDKVKLIKPISTFRADANKVLNESLPEWKLNDKILITESVSASKYANITFTFHLNRLYGYYLVMVG